jgi:hypothetical protein
MQNQNNQKKQLSHVMNATIVTGEYHDKNSNTMKKSYLTVGTLFVYQDGGMSLKLNALPANNQNIVFYPRKTQEHNPPMQNQHHQNNQNQHYQH